tara:strand:+ start:185 stop:721 length:537 start_codon:yes stop_codon:yes gene_type:complete
MEYLIRDIDPKKHKEIDLTVNRAMQTVLETIPEFKGAPENALKVWPNFTFDKMKEMFIKDYSNPDHRTLFLVDTSKDFIIGHAICSIKRDEELNKYGYCFSRYIDPEYRKRGLATKLLKEQEKWYVEKSAKYILAETHENNSKLKGLFEKQGYIIQGPLKGPHYNYFTLKKYINNQSF